MQHVWEEIVDLAKDEVEQQVREELDEKMPESVVATIVPPERPEEIDAFMQGLPEIPEPRQRIALIRTSTGQLAALLMNPYSDTGLRGSVSEIPLIHLPEDHNVQEQLSIMAGEPSEVESSVFFIPKADTQAIEQKHEEKKNFEAIQLTMETLFKTMMNFPEGSGREQTLVTLQELDAQYEDLMGYSYIAILDEEWREDHPE